MRINILLTLIFFFSLYKTYAQQIILRGQVFIHNSKYNSGELEYVENAYITAPFSIPDDSDSEGKFSLQFVNLDLGSNVKVTVEKDGLEVVNSHDLRKVIIGQKIPLKVFMTTKGQLAKSQTEFYEISKKNLYKEYNILISQLKKEGNERIILKKSLEKRFNKKFNSLYEAAIFLDQNLKEVEKRLPKFAQKLAEINLDFADDLYRNAYELFKNGKIENAIKTLDEKKLDDSYDIALDEISKAKQNISFLKLVISNRTFEIDKIINSYDLKADLFLQTFEWENALKLYRKILNICKEIENKDQQAHFHSQIASSYNEIGKYDSAILHYNSAINLALQENQIDSTSLIDYYTGIGEANRLKRKYNTAIKYYKQALALDSLYAKNGTVQKATIYNNFALALQYNGEEEVIVENYLKYAIQLDSLTFGQNHPKLAIRYSNLGVFYKREQQYDAAIKYLRKALSIDSTNYGPWHPLVSIRYNNLATTYRASNNYNQALEYLNIAFQIDTTLYGHNHPRVSNIYNNYGTIYYGLKKYDDAIDCLKKSIDIAVAISDSLYPGLAISYNNIGAIYIAQDGHSEAIKYFNLALEVDSMNFTSQHRNVAIRLRNLSNSYRFLGKYDKALNYIRRAVRIDTSIGKFEHFRVAQDFSIMGICYYSMKEFSSAKKCFETSLKIDSSLININFSRLANTIHYLGKIYIETEEYSKGINYINRAIENYHKILDPQHYLIAKSYKDICVGYKALKRKEDQKEFFIKSELLLLKNIKETSEMYGENHSIRAGLLFDIADLYRHMKKYNEAKVYYEKTIAIYKEILDSKHPKIPELYYEYASILKKLKLTKEAKRYVQKAKILEG